MEDHELKIRIRMRTPAVGEVEMLASPFGDQPTGEFSPPVSEEEADRLLDLAEEVVRRVEGKARGLETPPHLLPVPLGTALFRTLLPGDLETVYRRCIRAKRLIEPPFGGGQGLRLRLVFDLGEALGNEYLARLPWELLYDPVEERFVSRQSGLSLVRDLDWSEPLGVLPVPARLPIRLLLVDAAPRKMRQLELKTEQERIGDAVAPLLQQGEVEIFRADTLEGMRRHLRDKQIHVLHFMGHGGFLNADGLGALYFETPSGDRDQVDGDVLGEYLTGLPNLRLVVLCACHGARYADDAERPAHYGVAAGILQRSGVPAVIAMQATVSDAAAIGFAGSFYRELARGAAVDHAVTEARLALGRESQEWATPVLFLEAPHGRLFELCDIEEGEEPQRGAPRKLGVRSFQTRPDDDLGRHLDEVTDDCLDLRDLFEGRLIREDRLWSEDLFPRLWDFLGFHRQGSRPIEIYLAAHASVAYATGWILQAKSGLDLTVHQRTFERGELAWHYADGSDGEEGAPLWHELSTHTRGGGPDIALALSATRLVAPQVEDYLQATGLPVGRLISAQVAEEPASESVRGGAHAQRLSRSLAGLLLRQRREPGSRLHLFAAAPNALLVFLGQLGRPFGRTVLYEYGFESPDPWAAYQPSLELPPEGPRPTP
jgi:hypothetical protein